jgi:CRISPR/Cas system CSM-associated protein Csm2 small subunit
VDKAINFIKDNWMQISVVVVAFHTFLKAIRDAIDTTPDTDDNAFEKFMTISGKVIAYIFKGKRNKK